MTPDEIQEMREKHRLKVGDDCPDYCRYCHDIFPCDTIQVLDALDALANGIVEIEITQDECGHYGGEFPLCPRCGKVLEE